MTDPREPGTPEDPGIALPSWVDDAIAKSRTDAGGESAPADAGPAAEMAVNPPPSETTASSSDWQPVANVRDSATPPPVVGSEAPQDARRRAVLPWVALALIFLGAALAIGYILLTRSVQR